MKLEIDNIELSFDSKKILSGIYLGAETGKITGILGRNGCGKTSLLKMLFGSLTPKYGNVRLDGIHQKRKLFKTGRVAYLPQHQLLPSYLSLKEAFKFFDVNWFSFVEIFTSFKIYERQKVKNLSTGELRVIETYLILNSNREIILLDEPFSFIAPIYIGRLKTMLVKKKTNSVIILTDHYYNDILEVSDTIYFIKNGYSKIISSKNELENEGYLVTMH